MIPASPLPFSDNNCSCINCCGLCYSCYWYSLLSSYLLFGTESINVSNHLTNRACPGFAQVVLMDVIFRFAALSLPAMHTEHSRIHRFEYFLCWIRLHISSTVLLTVVRTSAVRRGCPSGRLIVNVSVSRPVSRGLKFVNVFYLQKLTSFNGLGSSFPHYSTFYTTYSSSTS
jgi:hypothetical protein